MSNVKALAVTLDVLKLVLTIGISYATLKFDV
jgi:hypothetical protein